MVDDLESIKGSPALTFAKLSEIAFGILTSSSIERYARIVAAAANELVAVTEDIINYDDILNRALTLWGMSLDSKERMEFEPELAIMVYVLYRHGDKASFDFIRAVASVPTPSTTWVVGLINYLKSTSN